MTRSFGLLAVAVLALIVVAGNSMLIPNANAVTSLSSIDSREDTGATTNLGTISIGGITFFPLPQSGGVNDGSGIAYYPAAGYIFLRWEVTGTVTVDDPNAWSTALGLSSASGTLTAIYQRAAPIGGPVGGFMEPANKLTIFAPYMGLLGVIGAVAVVVWKKREN